VGDYSPEMGLGRRAQGLGWGFYRRERGWRPGLELLGKVRPGGKTRGTAASLAPAGLAVAPAVPAVEENRHVEAS
jgi:hypothetical protein